MCNYKMLDLSSFYLNYRDQKSKENKNVTQSKNGEADGA